MTVCEHGMPASFGCDDCTIARLTARVAELEATPSKASELVGWEWRWKDTSPHTVTSGQWSEWKRVEARSRLSTVEDALREFRHYIAAGDAYELRPLYTPSQPAIPAPPECVTDAEKKAYAFGWWKALESNRMQAPQQAAPAVPYKDGTPHLSVGDSSFESWYASYNPAHKSDKQRARDAYAAGMGDPLVAAAPLQAVQEPTYPPLPPADKVMTPSNSEPYALWGLMRLMDYAKAYHAANSARKEADHDRLNHRPDA